MSLFTLDAEKCLHDGRCAATCPLGLIQFVRRTPVASDQAEASCIRCGHCVAACPSGALSLNAMPASFLAPAASDWMLTPDQMESLMKNRRSIRRFKSAPVAKETLERLIDIASHAPTGLNRQPVRWLVIPGRESVHRYAGMVIDWMRLMLQKEHPLSRISNFAGMVHAWEVGADIVCRKAPAMIIAYGSKKDITSSQSCTIAMTYLELAAPSFGLGVCWAGYFNAAINEHAPLKQALGLDEENTAFGSVMIGCSKEEFFRVPTRNPASITWRS